MPSKPTDISLTADKVVVRGPKVDGGYTISFEVGEYMQTSVAHLLLIPQQTALELSVSISE